MQDSPEPRDDSWPAWVRCTTPERARHTVLLYLAAFLIVGAAAVSSPDSVPWIELAIVSAGTVWAFAQWRFVRRQQQRFDAGLHEFLQELESPPPGR